MLTQFHPLLFSKIFFDKFETAIARLFVRNTLRGRNFLNYRSSHWRCYIKIAVLKNFVKFIGKHLCQSLLFNKVAGLRPTTLLKRDSGIGVFCEFCEIFKITFFTEQLRTTASVKLNKKSNYQTTNQEYQSLWDLGQVGACF